MNLVFDGEVFGVTYFLVDIQICGVPSVQQRCDTAKFKFAHVSTCFILHMLASTRSTCGKHNHRMANPNLHQAGSVPETPRVAR